MKSKPAFLFLEANSVLERALSSSAPPKPALTFSEQKVDDLVSHFLENSTDWKSIAALLAGGLAYRWGRTAALSSPFSVLSQGTILPSLIRGGSIAIGLISEVTAFELTNRTLNTIEGEHTGSPLRTLSPSPWSWSGPGGFKQSLINDLVTFGMLKGLGYLSRESNLIFQHGVQDLGMVSGHQLLFKIGWREKPEGSLDDQLFHAEETNLQLGAGIQLIHILAPKYYSFERGLDLQANSLGLILREKIPLKTEADPTERSFPLLSVGPLSSLGLDSILEPSNIGLVALGVGLTTALSMGVYRFLKNQSFLKKNTPFTREEKEFVSTLFKEIDPIVGVQLPFSWFKSKDHLTGENVRFLTSLILVRTSDRKKKNLPTERAARKIILKALQNHRSKIFEDGPSLPLAIREIFGPEIFHERESRNFDDPSADQVWTVSKTYTRQEILTLNQRILQGDTNAIYEAGVYYVIEDESIGGNAGENHFVLYAYVDAHSGLIRAVGSPESVPSEVKEGAIPLLFLIQFPTLDQILLDPSSAMKISEIYDGKNNYLSKGPHISLYQILKALKGQAFNPPVLPKGNAWMGIGKPP